MAQKQSKNAAIEKTVQIRSMSGFFSSVIGLESKIKRLKSAYIRSFAKQTGCAKRKDNLS